MNVGIIGGGNISDTHARAAVASGLTVAAVFGENREKVYALAARHGATAFDTLDALLRHPTLGLVMIGSPSGCHAIQAIAAARAGRHVLVEKPLDITTARIDTLLAEIDKAGVTLGVFFQDRLKPDVVALKQFIDSGALGVPLIATAEVKWFRPSEYYLQSRWRGTWALDGGGALMNQGIHTVDLLLYLLGPIVRVTGTTANRLHQIEAEDTAMATFQFASGVLGTMIATTAALPGFPRRLEIVGSKGTLVLEGDQLRGADLDTRVSQPAVENLASPVVSDISAHQRIVEDFVDAIRQRRQPVCDGHAGRQSVEVVEAVYRSAREGKTIEVG